MMPYLFITNGLVFRRVVAGVEEEQLEGDPLVLAGGLGEHAQLRQPLVILLLHREDVLHLDLEVLRHVVVHVRHERLDVPLRSLLRHFFPPVGVLPPSFSPKAWDATTMQNY